MKTNIVVALGALCLAATGVAQDYVVLDREADDFDHIQIQPDGTLRRADIISREVNVPATVIEEQRARTGLGYGGLLIGNALAAESGRTFDDVWALRQSGRGWGEIAQQYNVGLEPVVSRVHRADAAVRGTGNIKRDEMKAEKFVNGHDARDGKLDGSGPGHGHGHVKAAKLTGGGHGKGNGNGHGKGHGKH